MRFDDSLETVLSAEMSTPFGAQSAWRQLVDLMGRRRIAVDPAIIARLKSIRADVPPPVRAASARALAFTDPPYLLVRLFADDELGIAAPVLRVAQLRDDQWIEMLPGLSPAARSILRHRRDLGADVRRALDSFGTVDFVLPGQEMPTETPVAAEEADLAVVDPAPAETAEPDVVPELVAIETAAIAPPEPAPLMPVMSAEEPRSIDWTEVVGVIEEAEAEAAAPVEAEAPSPAEPIVVDSAPVIEPVADAAPAPAMPDEAMAPAETAPMSLPAEASFVSISSVALGLPVVAEALRLASDQPARSAPVQPVESTTGPFQISELVARIDAYQRRREESLPEPYVEELQPALFDLESRQSESFRFETDAAGVVRWVEGAARAPLIGLSLDLAALPTGSRVDGAAAGAFRRRAGFSNARLTVDGNSDAAGQWRITGIPVFDRANGRFTGYRGSARRPRADESAEPIRHRANPAAEALRQLVHELRTPTNAIAGFAEMIEGELLGPVPRAYRDHAGTIRSQASDLLTAIDDIDLAARIETQALDLRPGEVPVAPLLDRVAADLAPLAALRSTRLTIGTVPEGLAVCGDDRAVERLITRLAATLVAAGSAGETIGIGVGREGDKMLALVFDRPRALAAYAGDALLAIDVESEAEVEGAPLLGTGFALRLARNFAVELGGSLTIADDRLTLRLPAAVSAGMEQASTS